jgi:hypothetical protein
MTPNSRITWIFRKCFTDIDGKITEAGINSAIKEMKSNKSTGLDNISNEKLKSGQSFLILCLHKLFNNCFTMGYYSENWTHGYITPDFESEIAK